MVIGIDTNVFIYHFEKNPEFYRAADQILYKLSRPRAKGITSIVSLIELLSLPQSNINAKSLKNLYSATPNLTTVEVNEEIALEAARIRRQYGFRTSDAIQLATATTYHVNIFVTNDQQLKKFTELKIQLLSD